MKKRSLPILAIAALALAAVLARADDLLYQIKCSGRQGFAVEAFES